MTQISSIYNFKNGFIIHYWVLFVFPVFFGEELLAMLLKEEDVVELGRQVGVAGGVNVWR